MNVRSPRCYIYVLSCAMASQLRSLPLNFFFQHDILKRPLDLVWFQNSLVEQKVCHVTPCTDDGSPTAKHNLVVVKLAVGNGGGLRHFLTVVVEGKLTLNTQWF